MHSLLENFLVRFGFRVDPAGVKQVEAGMGKINKGMVALGAAAAVAGAAIFNMAKASLKLFSDIEVKQAKIVGLVGVSRERLNAMSEDVKKVAIETGKSLGELTQALFDITSAGLRGKNALELLSEASKASVAGLGEVNQLANTAAAVMRTFGQETINAAHFFDTLSNAIKLGSLDPATLSGTFSSYLSLAENMGVAFEALVGVQSAFSLIGVSASESSTQITAFLTALNKEGPEGEKVLNSLGSSFRELRDLMGDGPDGIIKAMDRIKELTGGDVSILSKIFGRQEAIALVNNFTEESAEIVRQMIEGNAQAAEDANKAVAETLTETWGRAKNNISTAMAGIGTRIAEGLKPLVEFVEDITAAMAEMPAWLERLISGMPAAVTAVGTLTAAFIVMRGIVANIALIWKRFLISTGVGIGLLLVSWLVTTEKFRDTMKDAFDWVKGPALTAVNWLSRAIEKLSVLSQMAAIDVAKIWKGRKWGREQYREQGFAGKSFTEILLDRRRATAVAEWKAGHKDRQAERQDLLDRVRGGGGGGGDGVITSSVSVAREKTRLEDIAARLANINKEYEEAQKLIAGVGGDMSKLSDAQLIYVTQVQQAHKDLKDEIIGVGKAAKEAKGLLLDIDMDIINASSDGIIGDLYSTPKLRDPKGNNARGQKYSTVNIAKQFDGVGIGTLIVEDIGYGISRSVSKLKGPIGLLVNYIVRAFQQSELYNVGLGIASNFIDDIAKGFGLGDIIGGGGGTFGLSAAVGGGGGTATAAIGPAPYAASAGGGGGGAAALLAAPAAAPLAFAASVVGIGAYFGSNLAKAAKARRIAERNERLTRAANASFARRQGSEYEQNLYNVLGRTPASTTRAMSALMDRRSFQYNNLSSVPDPNSYGRSSSSTVQNVGDIQITVNTRSNSSAKEIASAVREEVNQVVRGATEDVQTGFAL